MVELVGNLTASRQGATKTPGTANPVQVVPLIRETSPWEEKGELPWANSWGRERQEESTVQFTDCMESVGGGNLVVNRNRWASSQDKRWKKKKQFYLVGLCD